jgi:hypothetical protein
MNDTSPIAPALAFKALQGLDLSLTESVLVSGYFPHLFLSFRYEVSDFLPDGDRDLVVLVGRKDRADAMRELGEYPGRVVAVFCPHDGGIRPVDLPDPRGLPPNVVAAFTANNGLADRRAVSVPLGVRVKNLRTLQFVRQNHSGGREELLYGNFTRNDAFYRPDGIGTPHIRSQLVDRFRDESWATLDVGDRPRTRPEELVSYYSRIAGHRFVLSPEGNGADCYRTWEILYLGAIPIVTISPQMSAFTDLPILFTENYEELTEEYLEQRWREMSGRSFEIGRMLKSWYLNRFLESVSSLNDPGFVCWWVGDSPTDVLTLLRAARAAGGVAGDTPVPPFTDRSRNLLTPEAWNVRGLRLVEAAGGLRAIAEGDGDAVAEVALKTVAGAPFRLMAEVQPESEGAVPLTVNLATKRRAIAAADVSGMSGPALRLDFVAPSERTVLSIKAPETKPGTSWLLGDLSLQSNL